MIAKTGGAERTEDGGRPGETRSDTTINDCGGTGRVMYSPMAITIRTISAWDNPPAPALALSLEEEPEASGAMIKSGVTDRRWCGQDGTDDGGKNWLTVNGTRRQGKWVEKVAS